MKQSEENNNSGLSVNKKLLSFQPGSLYQNGGAARVLRRLYQGRESFIISVGIEVSMASFKTGAVEESIVYAFPAQQNWMRWKIKDIAAWLRSNVFTSQTKKRILKEIKGKSFDIVHIINHGPFCTALSKHDFSIDTQLWVSFHDYFSTSDGSFEDAKSLWNEADRRLVISSELGMEYQRLFGKLDFELITDGVATAEVSSPKPIDTSRPIIVYFAGLLHIDYYPLLSVFADALDNLTADGLSFKLIMRGTVPVQFLKGRLFSVEYRSDFVSDEAIKRELDEASILYLPIKFTMPEFYLYSLSTKMVGYLGAAGAILYHGPDDSAACNLLRKSAAAICSSAMEAGALGAAIKKLTDNSVTISAKAKQLARTDFNLDNIRRRFWQAETDTQLEI